jgi:hypothetical protein
MSSQNLEALLQLHSSARFDIRYTLKSSVWISIPYDSKERAAANQICPVCCCSLLVLITFRAVLIEQAVDFKRVLRANENPSVGNGCHAECYITWQPVAALVLIAVVNFVAKVGRVVGP